MSRPKSFPCGAPCSCYNRKALFSFPGAVWCPAAPRKYKDGIDTRVESSPLRFVSKRSRHRKKGNFNDKFDKFPWRTDAKALKAWQTGRTGIPIVDAGMRELWQTGYMHNRVRMIVGSFLVKNLLLSWHEGERWFWDTLLDADLASNLSHAKATSCETSAPSS